MITRTRQDWTPGTTVKVGFLSLRVIECRPTPGDWAPDAYVLESASGQRYEFVPHRGLTKAEG